jgi:hypothetical protein
MLKFRNNSNPKKLCKNHVCVSKFILNYARYSGTQRRMKCNNLNLSPSLT